CSPPLRALTCRGGANDPRPAKPGRVHPRVSCLVSSHPAAEAGLDNLNHLLRRFPMRRPLRSFRPRLEHPEDRTVPTVTFASNGNVLTFTGTNDADTLNLDDDGAGNITFNGTGIKAPVTVGGVAQIDINLKGGSDFVGYNLNGARTKGLTINADLKGG